jgi:hypothetical protein
MNVVLEKKEGTDLFVEISLGLVVGTSRIASTSCLMYCRAIKSGFTLAERGTSQLTAL